MELSTFLESTFQYIRSSKRTDKLHPVLLDEILNDKPAWAEYDWQFEYRLPVDGFGGTFRIDIAGFKNGELKVAILAKAKNSSINKNIKNYANTTVGESARLCYAPGLNLEAVLFVSVMPRVAPRFNKSGAVTGFDNVVRAKSRTDIKPVIQSQYNGLVKIVDVYYDIKDVRNKLNQSDFDTIIVENLDSLVYA